MPCWTPRAPQAVKTLLTFPFVLYRPHLSETSGSLGDKWFSHVSSRKCSSSCDIYPLGKPSQLSSTPTTGSLLCAIREFGGNFSPPFGRSLASFLGEARVWLGHPYPFTSSVIFSCAPACGTFPPRCWLARSPEPRAKDGGVVDAQTGTPVGVPLLCLFQFALLRVE